MRRFFALLMILAGCDPATDQADDMRPAAAAVIAAAAELTPADVDGETYALGDCPNCEGGRSGDGFAICPVCDGDGRIDQADLDRLQGAVAPTGDPSPAADKPSDPPAPADENKKPYRPPSPPLWEPATLAAYGQTQATHVLFLVYFTGPDCVPCRRLESTVWARDERSIADLVGVLYRDDSAGASQLAQLFRVTSTPQVCLVDGRRMMRWRGEFSGLEDVLRQLASWGLYVVPEDRNL